MQVFQLPSKEFTGGLFRGQGTRAGRGQGAGGGRGRGRGQAGAGDKSCK